MGRCLLLTLRTGVSSRKAVLTWQPGLAEHLSGQESPLYPLIKWHEHPSVKFIFMCVICMCICMFALLAHVCVGTCACSLIFVIILAHSPPWLLRRSFQWDPEPACMTSQLPLRISTIWCWDYRLHAYLVFTWILGIRTLVLMLVQQLFSHWAASPALMCAFLMPWEGDLFIL